MAPRIQLLGGVQIFTDQPRPSMWRRARELVTYLALHPGQSEEAFNEAIFPGELRSPKLRARRNEYMRVARRWLGNGPQGRPYLPLVTEGTYALHPDVEVDWHVFTALTGSSLEEAETKRLVKALEMVVTRPLSGIEEDYWEWAQAMKTRMCRQVALVAHEVSDRAAAEGDVLLARHAVEVGLQAVPEDSQMWDRALKVAHVSGGKGAVNAVARRRQRALAWD